MKQTIRYYTPVALLLVGILAVSALLTVFTGTVEKNDDRPQVMVTVYPLYVAAQNVVGDTDGVVLHSLTGSTSGCLHDYQLSPKDRLSLQQADLLLLNGAGAEGFLADLLPQLKQTRVVDTSAGLHLLPATHAHHGHGDHDHDHRHGAEEQHADHDHAAHDHEHEHDREHGSENEALPFGYNSHVWASPTLYAAQVQAVTEALCTLDPAHKAEYTANGQAYGNKVLAMGKRLHQAAEKLPSGACITFHDSLLYLAQDMGLTAVATLQVGEEAGVSAGDLAVVKQAVAADKNTLLLYDNQYTVRYEAVDQLVPRSHVLALDAGVVAHGKPTDWLDAMERNLQLITQITEEHHE